jgi:hypothetical protein
LDGDPVVAELHLEVDLLQRPIVQLLGQVEWNLRFKKIFLIFFLRVRGAISKTFIIEDLLK